LGRLVTHSDVTTADIDEALNRIEQAGPVPA